MTVSVIILVSYRLMNTVYLIWIKSVRIFSHLLGTLKNNIRLHHDSIQLSEPIFHGSVVSKSIISIGNPDLLKRPLWRVGGFLWHMANYHIF